MKKGIKILIISFLVVIFVSVLGSVFTGENVDSDWYKDNQPSITPPNYVFGPVWFFLYILVALSIYLSFRDSKKNQKEKLYWLFGINLWANLLWSFLFFNLQNPLAAFLDLIIIWITALILVVYLWKINKAASALLVPYLIWVSFAGVLNFLFL